MREDDFELLKITVYVKSILESILFCCQQGIALRGHREVIDTDSVEETTENVGNFRALMVLLSRNNDIVRAKLTFGPKSNLALT